jgi:putative heme transporter
MGAMLAYTMLTRATLPPEPHIPIPTLFRMQLSTKAVTNVVPGGSAAGSTLGYRLLTEAGVSPAAAGFSLATVGLGSAVVLNLLLWVGLLVSIPLNGLSAIYGAAAVIGMLLLAATGGLVFLLMKGTDQAERVLRAVFRKVPFVEEETAARFVRQLAGRLKALIDDPQLVRRGALWAAANWILDAAALWVFIRAFGATVNPIYLLIGFGLANVLAAIPITPGGLGYVDASYVTMLTGFGAPARRATLGVAAYRFAQFFFPIFLGGVMYLSLRVGPWSIERRDRLARLRDIAEEETRRGESKIDFQMRFPTRDDTGELIRRPPSTKEQIETQQERFKRWRRNRDE